MIQSFIDSLIQWFNDSMIQWFNDSMIHWFIDSMIQWFNDSMIHWFNDSMIQWFNDSMIHWFIDSMIQWFILSFIHSSFHPSFKPFFSFDHSFIHPFILPLSLFFSFDPLFIHPFTHSVLSFIHWSRLEDGDIWQKVQELLVLNRRDQIQVQFSFLINFFTLEGTDRFLKLYVKMAMPDSLGKPPYVQFNILYKFWKLIIFDWSFSTKVSCAFFIGWKRTGIFRIEYC